MVKRIFRYLRGTNELELFYKYSGNRKYSGIVFRYSDSEWVGSLDGKSKSESVLVYDGSIVDRKSRKQALVEISTTEAKMIAIVKDFKKQKDVHKQSGSQNCRQYFGLSICDNQAVIKISYTAGYLGKAKHIELRFLAIHHVVNRWEDKLKYSASQENLADLLTKALLP